MNSFLNNILNSLTKTKYYLVLANFLLVFFLILFSNVKILPMRMGDFIFFSLVYLIFALYRPGWSFLFFVGTIILENINLAPQGFGISIRPFQLAGGMTIISLILRFFVKRLNFEFVKMKWYDYTLGIFVVSGFVSAFFASQKGMAFKQSFILLTFVALYWLIRNYIQTLNDLKRIIPFFLSSSLVVVFYGIWQNILFIQGKINFEVMPGRPNSVFTEPDWLGIFLVLLVAVLYAMIYQISKSEFPISNEISNSKFKNLKLIQNSEFKIQNSSLYITLYYFYLVVTFILLILTVSRSAWLGAIFVTLVFLKAIFTNFSFKFRDWNGKELLKHSAYVIGAILLSLGFVYLFHLTNFQLFNRAQSTTSGLQKITIACDMSKLDIDGNFPEKINDVLELEKYGCRHINLEDIGKERDLGFEIKEIYRTDPNVNIRSQIYQKSFSKIKSHPIFGIGWGNISSVLGKDKNGNGFNSSNIFLEVWLGSGIVGLLAFLTLWIWIFVKSVIYCVRDDFESKIIGTFLVLGFFALLIPNLFNAGVYLGILWAFVAVSLSVRKN